jgi:hypothetical protein
MTTRTKRTMTTIELTAAPARRVAPVIAAAAALAWLPQAVAAQVDTTAVVTPGAEYAAGGLKRLLLGDGYRDLWTTPIRVPILNLTSFAGGLRPTRRGGGQQTLVLHLEAADGAEYVFRSVNKDPNLADEPALRNTPVSAIVRDQVSSLEPAAAAIVEPLLSSAGILHPVPTLVLMPDDPALGEYREEFGGVLGWIEERPDEIEPDGAGPSRPGFQGFRRIVSTERMLERIEESAADRVDARAFLTARLVDLVVGDWDRHHDQWRWAEVERDGVDHWVPIARDRDYALVDYDGLLIRVLRGGIENLVSLRPRITDLSGLTLNPRALDRRLLAGLPLAAWDSIASLVQARLTDEVIATAVRRMPVEHFSIRGPELEAILRGRRDDIVRAAREWYRTQASHVEIHGTDEPDLAMVERLASGVVRVRVHERGDDSIVAARPPFFGRTFYAPETEEIRIFLHGGDDRALVRGAVDHSVVVRLIGGGGDDALADSSRVRRGSTATWFHDDRGENRFDEGPDTRIDDSPYRKPASTWTLSGSRYTDWGDSRSISPVVGYRGTDGPIVGAGPVYTRYGFRSSPYAYRIGARARLGLRSLRPGLEVFGDFRRSNSSWGYGFQAEATRLENFRFFGFGNQTVREGDTDLYTVRQDQVSFRGYVDRRGSGRSRLAVGPVIAYTNPDLPEENLIGSLPRYGTGGFGQTGGWGELILDRRRGGPFPRSGRQLRIAADAFPGIWSAAGAFGSVSAVASSYLTPLPDVPVTLALRAGGEKVWGDFPVHEAAFLGGSRSVRGYSYQRFAGDAATFGNAELRAPLTTAVLLVRGTIGVLALADAGRVWFDGSSPGGWHTSYGGGFWFDTQVRGNFFGVSLLYARGTDDSRLYLGLGAPF